MAGQRKLSSKLSCPDTPGSAHPRIQATDATDIRKIGARADFEWCDVSAKPHRSGFDPHKERCFEVSCDSSAAN
jgi:hypothetical protein